MVRSQMLDTSEPDAAVGFPYQLANPVIVPQVLLKYLTVILLLVTGPDFF